MSDDGADLGMSANDGMRAALGDEEAQEAARRSPAELLAEMRADQSYSYSGQSNVVALALLGLYEERPELRSWPASVERAFFRKDNGERVDLSKVARPEWDDIEFRPVDDRDLWEELKAARPDLVEVLSDMSGFMWGWAVNAARYVVGEPPTPNPAIVTIGGGA